MYRIAMCFALTLVFAASSLNVGFAATNATSTTKTTITLKVLSCEGCAKRVREKLTAVSGVSEVTTDLKAKSATISPQRDATPSSKALWEAVEEAGKTPVKLVGPSGTFTSKPKN
ncbi:heavy-metal-associated domain-containing protein [Botrimarina mediterranea]|uniref:heavy-metal-associated domain-containing protein n=1 Tax=Botrimarina mediterranea TaxID=2528022 RepID=UPI0011893F52|nr:Heavy-metal-associated domain protein [Planctomycetes bacterium K2D]